MTDSADFLAVRRHPGGLAPLQLAGAALALYSYLDSVPNDGGTGRRVAMV
jgi:hypothetical protein